jgi:glycolate oxidase FAD binding subunit
MEPAILPANSWTRKLEEIVGPANVSHQPDWFRERAWEGPLPPAIAFPETREQVCEVMRLAGAERLKLSLAGQGTKQRMGGSCPALDLVLSLARLNRIIDYPASDLTISVEAGLPIRDLSAVLASHNQMLPLDMPFAERATLGGAVASNSTGARRLAYGSWRDMVLGIHFVTAEGKLAKGGGRVVKNVAGYDLPKLLIGSCGTLAAIVEVTLKVFPIPPATATFVLGFAGTDQAFQASHHILNSPLIPQALDFADSRAGEMAKQASLLAFPCNLLVGVAGQDVVVERFQRDLASMVRPHGLASFLSLQGEREHSLSRAVQELAPAFLNAHANGIVVKASLPLSQMQPYIARSQELAYEHDASLATFARAGSGIVYSLLWSAPAQAGEPANDQTLATLSALLVTKAERLGGRAVIEWCPAGLKSKINLWGTLGDDLPWMRRLKAALDPLGILNPGRFYGGI